MSDERLKYVPTHPVDEIGHKQVEVHDRWLEMLKRVDRATHFLRIPRLGENEPKRLH